ncbi:hypothetical protein EMEDMD4_320046 [Sinorhizobium medicae]|uniref:Uncharacterized protein n=1 Tax=Sinorhizobium medicae TaxID=110321 RepID=A0A508WZ56_9HYPH|nr:hypothetical protein EMEDMD4_320046 [Sinorhizobium medicae]
MPACARLNATAPGSRSEQFRDAEKRGAQNGMRESARFSARIPLYLPGIDHVHVFGSTRPKSMNVIE